MQRGSKVERIFSGDRIFCDITEVSAFTSMYRMAGNRNAVQKITIDRNFLKLHF